MFSSTVILNVIRNCVSILKVENEPYGRCTELRTRQLLLTSINDVSLLFRCNVVGNAVFQIKHSKYYSVRSHQQKEKLAIQTYALNNPGGKFNLALAEI